MAIPRSHIVDPDTVQVLHVFNRCVRRAFLCGVDSVSGRDYSHRKDWIRQRLEFLTAIFAFDIATYAVMSNHFHLVVRSRPDIVASWSDEEVAIRNLRLQGKTWFRSDGTPRQSTAAEIERIVSNPAEVLRLRRKLSDLSSLMFYFDRNLANRANQEDEVTGAFWEGTFRAELIEDEEALLACMTYVDLNPIRAMLAETLEESDYTGAFDRLSELRMQLATGDLASGECSDISGRSGNFRGADPDSLNSSTFGWATLDWERADHPTIGWLAPIQLDERQVGLDVDECGRRSSRRGFLPIPLLKYLEIAEWAGRQYRPGKSGSIPSEVPPILARLRIDSEAFLNSLQALGGRDRYFQMTERQGVPDRRFSVAQSA